MKPFAAPIRSALYLPAINTKAIAKARTLPADAVIFDLEDAVAPEKKAEARANLEAAFQASRAARGQRVIRTNVCSSSEFAADIGTVLRCRPDAILLPKVESPADVAAVRDALGPQASLAIWCMVETPRGLLRLEEIAAVANHESMPVRCLVVGTNDIARETRVSTANGRAYMQSWLLGIVLVARAHDLAVLDGVWNDFKDTDGFDAEARQGADMGFDGKTLIHPSQVEGANRAFAPAPESIAEARAIVEAFERPGAAGMGVINIDGKMVELLHLEMARRTLAMVAAIDALETATSA